MRGGVRSTGAARGLGRPVAGRPLLVIHRAARPEQLTEGTEPASARAGFVVGRTVGGAVVRNRVRRRLQHAVAERLPTLPAGTRLVVRALPASAAASFAELSAALDEALAGRSGSRGKSAPAGSTS